MSVSVAVAVAVPSDELNEAHCTYVSSRGLMKSCDVYPPNPTSSTRMCYNYAWETLSPGAIVYVISSAIPHFRSTGLPRINVPFVLVSGDCDETIPFDIFSGPEDTLVFLEDPRIVAWFCQNCTIAHPKAHQLPIGLDYHTLSVNTRHSWGPKQTPEQQERIVTLLAKRAEDKTRVPLCYSNFHFSMNTKLAGDRRQAISQVPVELMFYEPNACPRFDSWLHQLKYLFVLSPHGGGLDCHRTWEALAIGCYPVVRSSALDELFSDLPILIVKEWSDVTGRRLAEFAAEQERKKADGTFSLKKVQLVYWTDRMRTIGATVAA